MRKTSQKTFLAIAVACVAAFGFAVLDWRHGALSTAAPVTSEITQHPDFDVQLLREAAKKYQDPNDIESIPDDVIIEDFVNIAFSDHVWESDYPWHDEEGQKLARLKDKNGSTHRLMILQPPRNRINKRRKLFYSATWDRGNYPTKQDVRKKQRKVKGSRPYDAEMLSVVASLPEWPSDGRRYNWSRAWIKDEGFIRNDQEQVNPFKYRETLKSVRSQVEVCKKRQAIHTMGIPDPCDNPLPYRHALKAAVRFTPYLKAQVEGYFFSDEENQIFGGTCWIADEQPIKLMRALFLECVTRQLGLPDHSLLFEGAVLGQWGRPLEPYAAPVVPAGISQGKTWRDLDAWANFAKLNPALTEKHDYWKMLQEVMKPFPIPQKITAYDLLIVRILYDSRLSSGMTVDQAREVLPPIVQDARSWLKKYLSDLETLPISEAESNAH